MRMIATFICVLCAVIANALQTPFETDMWDVSVILFVILGVLIAVWDIRYDTE